MDPGPRWAARPYLPVGNLGGWVGGWAGAADSPVSKVGVSHSKCQWPSHWPQDSIVPLPESRGSSPEIGSHPSLFDGDSSSARPRDSEGRGPGIHGHIRIIQYQAKGQRRTQAPLPCRSGHANRRPGYGLRIAMESDSIRFRSGVLMYTQMCKREGEYVPVRVHMSNREYVLTLLNS